MSSLLDQAKQLFHTGQMDKALPVLDAVLKTEPRNLDAQLLRAMIAEQKGDHLAAARQFATAMDLSTDRKKDIGFRAASSFLACGQLGEAVSVMRRLYALMPEDQNVIQSLCGLLREMGHYPQAAPFAEKLSHFARDYDGLLNAGIVLSGLARHEEAFPLLGQAYALKPGDRLALSELFWCAANLCDFEATSALQQVLLEGYAADGAAPDIRESAFRALMWSGDEAYLKQAGQRTASGLFQAVQPLPPADQPRRAGRLRIGYVSNDFYDHATMSLMAGVLEAHDRTRFEIFGFCYTEPQNRKGRMRTRFENAVDHVVDILDLPDEAVLKAIRHLDIDILVDLKGFTQGSRLSLFMGRAARAQITWLGFPGTVPGAGLDYVIGDRFVTPPASQPHFDERILTMPVSYQANDATRDRVFRTGPRDAHGLPDDAIVYCSFNQAPKIRLPVFEAWMQILQQVDRSVLWLGQQNKTVMANLRTAARARGVDPARIVFADVRPLGAHLARLPQADIALDTAPCNGHTTTSDALWAGVPVVSVKGTSFAGRVSESLLSAIGLPHLVTENLEAYVALAVALGRDEASRLALRDHLHAARTNSPLFDSQTFTRDLEALYQSVAG